MIYRVVIERDGVQVLSTGFDDFPVVMSRQFAGKVMEAIDDGLDVVDDDTYDRMSEVSEQLRAMIGRGETAQ